jgi:hypothetical protein
MEPISPKTCDTCRGGNLGHCTPSSPSELDPLGKLCAVCRRLCPPFKFRAAPHHCNYEELVESASSGCYLCELVRGALLDKRCEEIECSGEDAELYYRETSQSHLWFQQTSLPSSGPAARLNCAAGLKFWRGHRHGPQFGEDHKSDDAVHFTMFSTLGKCGASI